MTPEQSDRIIEILERIAAAVERLSPPPSPPPTFPHAASERVKAIATLTGHTPGQLRAIAARLSLPDSSRDFTPEQVIIMRDALLLDFAAKFDCWNHRKHCQNAFTGLLRSLPPEATDTEIFQAWRKDLHRRQREAIARPC